MKIRFLTKKQLLLLVLVIILVLKLLYYHYVSHVPHKLVFQPTSVNYPERFDFPANKVHKKFRILVLPGGGVRAFIPLTLLHYIETRTGKPIHELFDLVVATSSGSILAAGLVTASDNDKSKVKYSAKEIEDVFYKGQKIIFSATWWHELFTLHGLIGPTYQNSRKNKVLQDALGDTLFADSLIPSIVTAYSLSSHKAIAFKSWEPAGYEYYSWELVAGSSSPPSYFSPVTISTVDYSRKMTLVDGGIFANNPLLSGYLTAKKYFPNKEVLIASLGTGADIPVYDEVEVMDWGKFHWANSVLDLMIVANSDYVTSSFKELMANNTNKHNLSFYNFNINIPHDSSTMFDASDKHVAVLKKYGYLLLLQQKKKLDALCDELVKA